MIKINKTPPTTILSFKAKLIIPKYEEVSNIAGEVCALHLEKARPTIEKISKATKDIEEIKVTPLSKINSNTDSISSQIKIDVLTNNNIHISRNADELTLKQDNPFNRPFYKYIVDTLIDTIGSARLCDAILKHHK